MDTQIKLQNQFINDLIKNKQLVSLFLINGIKLQGIIDRHENTTLVIRSMNSMLVYKRYISTIIPAFNGETKGIAEKT